MLVNYWCFVMVTVLNYDPKLSIFDELEIRHERKEDYGWMDGWMDGTSIQPSVIKHICYCSLLPVPLRVLGKPLIFWLSRQGCGLLSDVRAACIFVYLWFKRHQDATLDITHRPVSGKLQVHLPTQKHPCSQSKTKRQHEQGQCCTRPIRSEKGMSIQDTPHLKKKKRLCWCLQGFWWSLFWYRPHDQASQTATCLLIKGQTNVFPPTWQQSALFPKGQSCSYLSRAIICAWEQELRLISPSRNLTRHLWLQNSIDTRINYNSLL